MDIGIIPSRFPSGWGISCFLGGGVFSATLVVLNVGFLDLKTGGGGPPADAPSHPGEKPINSGKFLSGPAAAQQAGGDEQTGQGAGRLRHGGPSERRTTTIAKRQCFCS